MILYILEILHISTTKEGNEMEKNRGNQLSGPRYAKRREADPGFIVYFSFFLDSCKFSFFRNFGLLVLSNFRLKYEIEKLGQEGCNISWTIFLLRWDIMKMITRPKRGLSSLARP